MHRKDREITDPAVIESILEEAMACRIGMTDGETPYVVPMNFAYREKRMYIHSAQRGRKVDLLRRNPRVCFEADDSYGIIPGESACATGFRYRSVIGFGRAVFIVDPEEKRAALEIFMEKYAGHGRWDFPDHQIDGVAVIRIDIETMTGKHRA